MRHGEPRRPHAMQIRYGRLRIHANRHTQKEDRVFIIAGFIKGAACILQIQFDDCFSYQPALQFLPAPANRYAHKSDWLKFSIATAQTFCAVSNYCRSQVQFCPKRGFLPDGSRLRRQSSQINAACCALKCSMAVGTITDRKPSADKHRTVSEP